MLLKGGRRGGLPVPGRNLRPENQGKTQDSSNERNTD